MKRINFLALLIALPILWDALEKRSTVAADWPQFRGPGGSGVSSESGLPIKWSATENLRWKADLPGRGLSNPVIAGGRVYVTASSGHEQGRLHVLSFDAATGKKLWERQFWATGGTSSHPKTCMAAPTPATDGKHVYALFATGDLVCLDGDGNLAWYRSLVGDYPTITNQVGMAASPVLWKDLVFVPMENEGDSFLGALDVVTGKNRWKAAQSRGINWTTPLVVAEGDGALVLFQSGQQLAAYDAATGSQRWSHKSGGLSTIPSPAVGSGMILVPGGDLLALRPASNGATPEVLWKNAKLRPGGFSTPLYYQDRVYSVGGIGLNCASASDGKLLWQERAKGPFSASPVAGDGKIYLVNEEGTTTVFQAGNEAKLLATNSLNDTILATPAIADGALYLRSDGHLYCIGSR
jgi:outer membrane protein assembly factor BamB